VHQRRDKLERESTATAAVESTLANVISSCLEGNATRKLGKVWPAACSPFWLADMRGMLARGERKNKGEKEGQRGYIRVRGCIVALMAASIKHPRACTLDHGRLQCHYLC